MGIYGKIFKTVAGAFTGQKKDKPKNKKMKKLKLTPEQKARLKGAGKKAFDYVQSGKLATTTGVVTRYAQGKPVVIKRTMSKEEKQATPDTVNFFGYQIPKTYAYVGGGLAVAGIAYIATRNK